MNIASIFYFSVLWGCESPSTEPMATPDCTWDYIENSDFATAPVPAAVELAYEQIDGTGNLTKRLYRCLEVEGYYISEYRRGNDPWGYSWISYNYWTFNSAGDLCEECSWQESDYYSEDGYCALLDVDVECVIIKEDIIVAEHNSE